MTGAGDRARFAVAVEPQPDGRFIGKLGRCMPASAALRLAAKRLMLLHDLVPGAATYHADEFGQCRKLCVLGLRARAVNRASLQVR